MENQGTKWSIVKHFPGYNPVSKRCMLCTNEKLHRAEYAGDNLINTFPWEKFRGLEIIRNRGLRCVDN